MTPSTRPSPSRPRPPAQSPRPPLATGSCPSCAHVLSRTCRLGVEVNDCAGCRGVFLSAAALTALLDRERSWTPPAVRAFAPRGEQVDHRERRNGRLEVLQALTSSDVQVAHSGAAADAVGVPDRTCSATAR